MTNPISRFLQVDHLICDFDGRPLNGWKGYIKDDLHPQFFFFTWGWLKSFFGDHHVLRFCDRECYRRFLLEGRMRSA